MAEYPVLPLFTDAFIADTTHLNSAQTGAYLMLIICAWRTPDCRLPDDDKMLSKMARMEPRVWMKNKDTIMAFWRKDETGKWYQRRLVDERKNVAHRQSQNVIAGRASALKRKERHSTTVSTKPQHDSNPLNLNLNLNPSQYTAPTSESVSATDEFKLESEPSKPEKKNGKCGPIELPPNWQPDGESVACAATLGVDLEFALAELRDWAAAKRPKYHDWNATFRNSLRRFAKSGKTSGQRNAGHGREPSGIVAAGLRVAARFEAKEKAGL